MFSKACEYAIRAMIYIQHESAEGRRPGLKSIAETIESPEAFTAKILQKLTKDGLLNSAKGPNGGFMTGSRDVCLTDIVRAIDGDGIFTMCGLGLKHCSEVKPCPVHHKFKKIRGALKDMLDSTSMDDLTQRFRDGRGHLAT